MSEYETILLNKPLFDSSNTNAGKSKKNVKVRRNIKYHIKLKIKNLSW